MWSYFFLITDFLVHFWLLPKNLTITSTFSIPITIPTYQHQHTTYQHITYHVPTYHIPHSTYHILTYHHILHSILFLLFMRFFYYPNFCVCQYSIILPKIYTILELKSILWNWCLQIKGILVNSAFGMVSTS